MSFPSNILTSQTQGSYPSDSSKGSSRPPQSNTRVNSNEQVDPKTEAPLLRPSVSSLNQGLTTSNLADEEQNRTQGAAEEFGLQSGAITEAGTEEDFDNQEVNGQFDQNGEIFGEQLGGQIGTKKTEGDEDLQGATIARGGSREGNGNSRQTSSGSIRGGSGSSSGGTRGEGSQESMTATKGGSRAQSEGDVSQAGGKGALSSQSSSSFASGVVQAGKAAASSILGDMAYSVVKDVGDTAYGQIAGNVYSAKTAYIDANGIPAIFPPKDTFNVYVAECDAETTSNNTQWISINAQVAAINGLSTEQETEENNSINDTLNAIAAQAAAAAAGQKAQSTNNIIEGVSIGIAVALIVTSAACYLTGVGAGAGIEEDAEAGALIGADATGAEGGGLGIGDAAAGEESADASTAAADEAEASSGRTAFSGSNTTEADDANAAKAASSEDELDDAEAGSSRTAFIGSDSDEAADAKAVTKAGRMTSSQLASYQFMGFSSLVMSIPQAGNAIEGGLTNSLEKDGLSAEDAQWVSMAIIAVSMIIAGGLFEGGISRLSSWNATREATAMGADAAATTVKATSSSVEEETTLTLSERLTNAGKGISSATQATKEAFESMLTGLYKWGKSGLQTLKSMPQLGEDSMNALIKSLTEAANDPVAALVAPLKMVVNVTMRVLYKSMTGFLKLAPDISAFSDAAVASTTKEMLGDISRGVGSCLPAVVAIGQSVNSALAVYESSLQLKLAEAQKDFAQDSASSMQQQAYATSTENVIQACDQALNQQIQIANSMMTATEQTVGDMQSPIAS